MNKRDLKLNINGMSCSGCANIVKNALSSVPGVKEVEVDLAGKIAVLSFKDMPPSIDLLIETIRQTGFDAGRCDD